LLRYREFSLGVGFRSLLMEQETANPVTDIPACTLD